ncbi:M20/M25/M40 family metallo-hydrolase [Hymenobacter sp. DG01]|uniref:M20/M25/M40 family metallo-hydrolase n=1 Tax=Hymenobacter sp. DG01 TaxID=2584940 RepID=UPI0011229312|nr:M20/M25/M40 family metallo-hydrolase [Hymenobacter sp. DG01]
MLRKSLLFLLACTALLGAVLVFNTLRFSPPAAPAVGPLRPLNLPDSALSHFRQAIRYRTVSLEQGAAPDSAQFLGFHRFLQRAYPRVHAQLKREVVNQYTLLYSWPGQDAQAAPIVLMAHYDVVPVEESTAAKWEHDPWAGEVHQDRIWGRGAVDNKANVTALLEAAEQLLLAGFQPSRTVYFVFGHDEEVGGQQGAQQVARLLQQRGIKPEFVLDEGGFVTTDRVPGLKGTPVALIGTAEKGYLSLELTAEVAGGHSSIPEAETATDLIAQAVVALRKQNFPASFTPSMDEFAAHIGPRLPFVQRLAFANAWLLRPLILSTYTKTASGAAAVRTTLVPTILQAGVKDNVVPTSAKATVNLRLLPGTSSAEAVRQVQALLPDQRVTVKPVGTVSEPSPAAPTNATGYQLIEQQIRLQIQDVIPTPFLFVALSDSRHFQPLTSRIYKFSPMTNPAGLHGLNESLSVESYQQCFGFYHGLLKAAR